MNRTFSPLACRSMSNKNRTYVYPFHSAMSVVLLDPRYLFMEPGDLIWTRRTREHKTMQGFSIRVVRSARSSMLALLPRRRLCHVVLARCLLGRLISGGIPIIWPFLVVGIDVFFQTVSPLAVVPVLDLVVELVGVFLGLLTLPAGADELERVNEHDHGPAESDAASWRGDRWSHGRPRVIGSRDE